MIVTPGVRETLGLKLVEGRFYEEADPLPAGACSSSIRASRGSSSRMALPLVESSLWRSAGKTWKTGPVIIGVVKDVPHNGVEEKSGNPFIYQSCTGTTGRIPGCCLADRPAGGDAVSALREKVRAIDPSSTV